MTVELRFPPGATPSGQTAGLGKKDFGTAMADMVRRPAGFALKRAQHIFSGWGEASSG